MPEKKPTGHEAGGQVNFLGYSNDQLEKIEAKSQMNSVIVKRDGTKVNRRLGERSDFYRNREIQYAPGTFVVSDDGHVLERPVTKRLPCFADPVEYWRGVSDQAYRRMKVDGTTDYRASGCARCPVRDHCFEAVDKRVNNSPELAQRRDAWEADTKSLTGDDSYSHPSWAAFVDECEREAERWTDCNEANLEQLSDERRERRATNAASKRKEAKPRPKAVPKAVAGCIALERHRRAAELLELNAAPDGPLWIRNRAPERCVLIADAWQARAMLVEANAPKDSGRAVADWLVANGRVPADMPSRFVKTVEEALRRADQQWPDDFYPYPAPIVRGALDRPAGMHPDAVFEQLEA